jgi:hypothetical protein
MCKGSAKQHTALSGQLLFRNTAAGLEELGQLIAELESGFIAEKIQMTSHTDQTPILQDIDLALQTIAELGALLLRVSDAPIAQQSVSRQDIVSPMKLERLRDMIGSDGRHRTPLQRDHTKSDMQLF